VKEKMNINGGMKMSSADVEIHRSSNGYYDNKKRNYCKNCGKDVTDIFYFEYCSRGCRESHTLKIELKKLIK
jgi:hypothetical protein